MINQKNDSISDIDAEDDLNEYRMMLKTEATSQDKLQNLRTFPLPIGAKRALLEAAVPDFHLEKDSTTCVNMCQNFYQCCKAGCRECCTSMDPWLHHVVVIERMFGAGVGSFFSLLRSLFLLNAVLFLVFLIFLILPQGLNSSSAAEAHMMKLLMDKSQLAYTCSKIYQDKLHNDSLSSTVSAKVLDFLSGTGWMEKTILFFGAYFPVEHTGNSITYNYPLAYFFGLGVSFFASIVMLLNFTSQNFHSSILNKKRFGRYRYSNFIFAGWDYSLTIEKNAHINSKIIYNEFVGNMRDDAHRKEMKNMSGKQKCHLFAIRAIIGSLILVILIASAYLIYFVQVESSAYTAADVDHGSFVRLIMEYLPSVTIGILCIILPFTFKRLVRFEKYNSETVVLLTLLRIVFVKLFLIVTLVGSLYSLVTCSPKDTCFVGTGHCKAITCWETYVGQQFYKLAITQFGFFFADTFGVEWFHYQIVMKRNWKLLHIIGQPEFDIPKCVLDLIYVQIITWFGSLFCPMLPGIAALMLFILFYMKLFACHKYYKISTNPFKTSRSNVFFLIVLIFAYFLCILPIGYCIVKMTTSKGCGPFRTFTNMYDVIPGTIDTLPSWAASFMYGIGSMPFAVVVMIILLIIIYYYATLAHTRLFLSNHLQAQLNTESHNKQILYQQLLQAGIMPAIKRRRSLQI